MIFTLDYTKWANASTAKHQSDIKLYNKKTDMSCCLGLCALSMGISKDALDCLAEPEDVIGSIKATEEKKEIDAYGGIFASICLTHDTWRNNKLSYDAMEINDDATLDMKTRVKDLTELFADHEHTLTFINLPAEEVS